MSLVTLALAKEMLGIAHSNSDNILQLMLDGAEEFVQKECGVHFYPSTATEHTEDHTIEHVTGQHSLYPRKLPIITVTSVTDRGDAEDETEWDVVDTEDYRYDEERILRLGQDSIWEHGELRYRVVYTGGYTASTIPTQLKVLVLNLVYRAYNARGMQSSSSAAGASVSWSVLLDSDMAQMIQAFNRGKPGIG